MNGKILLSLYNIYCGLPLQRGLEGTAFWCLGTKPQELWVASHISPQRTMGLLQKYPLSHGYWELHKIFNKSDANGLKTRTSLVPLFLGLLAILIPHWAQRRILNNNPFLPTLLMASTGFNLTQTKNWIISHIPHILEKCVYGKEWAKETQSCLYLL